VSADKVDETRRTTLRKGYYGASPMAVEVLREFQRRLPSPQLWNFYGQTELAPVAAVLGARAAGPSGVVSFRLRPD
jgi:acyl-CoA synthetase (AMP-forming)/AMP-acid ligase II